MSNASQEVIPPTPSPLIPRELLDRLTQERTALLNSGSVIQRREKDRYPSFCLRLRKEGPEGYRKHFSIALGKDEKTAAAVRMMLKDWRAEARGNRHAEEATQKTLRRLRRAYRIFTGSNWRSRRKAAQAFDRALAGGPAYLLMLPDPIESFRPGRRGRPSVGRLW